MIYQCRNPKRSFISSLSSQIQRILQMPSPLTCSETLKETAKPQQILIWLTVGGKRGVFALHMHWLSCPRDRKSKMHNHGFFFIEWKPVFQDASSSLLQNKQNLNWMIDLFFFFFSERAIELFFFFVSFLHQNTVSRFIGHGKLAFRRACCRRASSLKSLRICPVQPGLKNITFLFWKDHI